jgi:hypothetical protein
MTWGNLATHGARVRYSGTSVYSGAIKGGNADLDLSSVVGARRAYVMLRLVKAANTGATNYWFRPNGETYNADYYSKIFGQTGLNSTNSAFLWVFTGTDGIIECSYSGQADNTEYIVEAFYYA